MADPFAAFWGQSAAPPAAIVQQAQPGPLTMNLIKGFEGYAPKPKWDHKQYSVGYGTRWQPGQPVGTREDHEQALAREVSGVDSWIAQNVKVPLDEKKRAGLTSFGFNLGAGNLQRLLPDINAGAWDRVGNRMLSFNKASGQVLPGLVDRRRKEAAYVLGQEPSEMTPMPQSGGGLTAALGGGMRRNMPQMLGGSEEQGYFGRVMQDPTFLMGASVLGAGLSGRDAGSALATGAQAASATSEMTEKRRRAAQWQKLMQEGSPALEGVPPDVLAVMQAAGPDEGMKMLGQLAMERQKRGALRELAPGASLYDPASGKAVFTAPTSQKSPYDETVQRERAKADVDAEGRAKVGTQMLGLLEGVKTLAGQEGTPQAETFEGAVGPLQGTGTYQKMKGFFNSQAQTPQVFNDMQQYLGTVRMLAQRAYLSGQGQVTEAERKAVNDAIGAVESAPSREAAIRAVNTLEGIISGVFLKAPGSQAPAPGGAPGGEIAAPGMAVEGGMPQAAPQPQQQPSGRPRITDGRGNVMELDETGTQWVPAGGAQPQPQAAGGQPAAPAPAQQPSPFSRSKSPLWATSADKATLRSNPTPEMIQQYDAVFGQGSAQAVLGERRDGPIGVGRYNYRTGR